MSNTLHPHTSAQVSNDYKSLAKLYDEHAAVVLGFLEKLADDKDKAEELLQAVFLALPSRLSEFDPQKGRFVVWLLRLARGIANHHVENTGFQTNGSNVPTNQPIHAHMENVNSIDARTTPAANPTRRLMPGNEMSVVELLYVKGYTFVQAAAELGADVRSIQSMVRTELKKYRR